MSWRGVGDDVLAPQGHRGLGLRPLAELAAAYDPEPERIAGACQARLAIVRLDGVYDDARVAEGRALEHGLEPGEQAASQRQLTPSVWVVRAASAAAR